MKLNEHLQIPKIKVVYYHYIAYICLTFATFTVAGTIHNVAASDFLSAAIVRSYGGDGLLIREGTTRKPFQEALDGSLIGELRRFRDVLEIQGDNRSGARLSFTTESSVVVDYGGLSIQTRPGRRAVEYRFPCGSARGNLTIGWRYAGMSRDRACNDGINVGPRRNWFSKHPDTDYISILSSLKSLTVAQVEDDGVLVAPNSSGQLLIDVTDNNDRVEIVAIVGDARVTSKQFPIGKTLNQGQQYTYFGNGSGTINTVNLGAVIDSSHIQYFLNPDTWSSPDLPGRMTDGITNQINEHINSINSSIPVNLASCPLTGNWMYYSTRDFSYSRSQGFFDDAPPYNASVKITEEISSSSKPFWFRANNIQYLSAKDLKFDKVDLSSVTTNTLAPLAQVDRGTPITISGFYMNSSGSGQGQRLGNQIFATLPLYFGNGDLSGVLSPDSNEIQGTILFSDGNPEHSTATIPFTMTRETPCQ